MGLRLTAAIPLFASIVSVALTIVLLVSGSSTNNADGNFWLSVRFKETIHIGYESTYDD